MSALVLDANGVGKCYATYRSNLQRFLTWFGAPIRPQHEYWAVKDVSIKLHAGDALAIVGQNGAGKSTLLKLITGTVRASTGTINVLGKVSAILELGLGFNPEFTGRQNIYLSGGLMGLPASQIDKLMPEIEDFAELGEFIDQPLRVYSSGMNARLAFSVVTAVRPDVLIVDEVLSVGDSYFQHKSFNRIRQFKDEGTSILFVTHGLTAVRTLCERVILLDKGQVLKDGLPDEVLDYYNAFIAAKENAKLSVEQRREKNGWLLTKSGTGEATIISLKLNDGATGQELAVAQVGQQVQLELKALANQDLPQLVIGLMIRDKQGHIIWGTNTWHTQQVLRSVRKGQCVGLSMPFTCTIGPGSYSITVALTSSESHVPNNYEWTDNLLVFDVVNVDRPVFGGSAWLDAKLVLKLKP
jgi:lipopolysaccharide transport system ATP-binding protein